MIIIKLIVAVLIGVVSLIGLLLNTLSARVLAAQPSPRVVMNLQKLSDLNLLRVVGTDFSKCTARELMLLRKYGIYKIFGLETGGRRRIFTDYGKELLNVLEGET